MRRLITVAALFCVPACGCFDTAYDDYCRNSPLCDGGSATGGGAEPGGGSATGGGSSGGGSAIGGGSAMGGGSATGGGSAVGGGSAMGGGSATGGGSAPDGGADAGNMNPATSLALTIDNAFHSVDCVASGQVERLDSSGNPTFEATSLVVTLDGAGLVQFYDPTNGGCTGTGTSTVTITAGQSSASFNYLASVFGKAVVKASSGNLTAGQATVTADAQLQVTGNDAILANNTACQQDIKLTVVAVSDNTKQIAAKDQAPITVAQNGNIEFGTSCSTVGSTPIQVVLSPGQMAAALYDKVFAVPGCGAMGTITITNSSLPDGLTLGPAGGTATVYYQQYPAQHSCSADQDCCSVSCVQSTQKCN